MIQIDETWKDPEAPWWVKLRRATELMIEVGDRCNSIKRACGVWRVESEDEDAQSWRYRFRVLKPILLILRSLWPTRSTTCGRLWIRWPITSQSATWGS